MTYSKNASMLLGLLVSLTLAGCGAFLSPTTLTSPAISPPPASQTSTVTPARPAVTAISLATQTLTSEPGPTATHSPTRSPISTPTVPDSARLSSATLGPEPLSPPSPAARSGSGECPCQIEHVVIISIDGLRPDALAQADTPTLDALQLAGAYSPAAQAVLPSVTLVNHASMLGGMSPEQHGIYWNVNAPDLGKVKGPTLFSVAHAAGLSTAMVVGKPKLEHLVLPGSVDNYIYAGFTDRQVVDEALAVIQAGLPNVFFIHLPDVDSAGHAAGWMSPVQLMVLNRTDALIGELVAALEAGHYLDRTLLIVTSDHGGHGIVHGGDSPEEMTVPWLAVGPGVPAGRRLQSQIVTYDTAATALYAFQLPVPPQWQGQPVLEIFGKAAE